MTYQQLTATTKYADLPAALNGVSTRRVQLPLARRHDATNSTTRGTNGSLFQEGFAVGEQLQTLWIPCDRVDAEADATLRLHLAMQAAGGAGDEVRFDARYLALDTDANDGSVLTTAALTDVVGSDVDVSAFSAGGIFRLDYTIPAAAISVGDLLNFEIERMAPSGTSHSMDVGLVAVEVAYSIER